MRKLLGAVPNLELLELPQDSASPTPGAARPQSSRSAKRDPSALAEGAVDAGADTVVTMYHSCHRALAGAEAVYPLKVVTHRRDRRALAAAAIPTYYRLYKQGGAMDEAVAAARKFCRATACGLTRPRCSR